MKTFTQHKYKLVAGA